MKHTMKSFTSVVLIALSVTIFGSSCASVKNEMADIYDESVEFGETCGLYAGVAAGFTAFALVGLPVAVVSGTGCAIAETTDYAIHETVYHVSKVFSGDDSESETNASEEEQTEENSEWK